MIDDREAAQLQEMYFAPEVLNKYEVQTGTVEFQGATVSGELRALCGLKAGLGSLGLAKELSGQCLPRLLESQGYATTAIHGFMGAMFDREHWYRDLGFQNVRFLENLRKAPGIHICGGIFPGICDADIVRILRKDLTAQPARARQFYYWLTLNSHLPIPVYPTDPDLRACVSPEAASSDRDICAWMTMIGRVNHAIADLSVDPEVAPTEFIIVGDHAPPFLTTRARNEFSQTLVPFIHLVPKA